MRRTNCVLYLVAFASLVLPCRNMLAQLPPKTDTTRTPIPGAGHDYLGGFTESVNPANGSVSLRIPLIVPPSRGITLPFQFLYDSSGVNFLSQLPDRSTPGPLYWMTTNQDSNLSPYGFSQTGWSAGIPQISRRRIDWTTTNTVTDIGHIGCHASIDYVYQDEQGVRHNLGLTTYSDPGGTGPCTINSQDWPAGFGGGIVTQGGEGSIVASLASSSWSDEGSVGITEADGSGLGTFIALSNPIGVGTPGDRYGNYTNLSVVNYPAFTYTDSSGRLAVQDSGFAVDLLPGI